MKRPCKACGRKLHFVKSGETGKLIPLDLEAQVYFVTDDKDGTQVALKQAGVFVSHFQTCPKASEFSGRGAAR